MKPKYMTLLSCVINGWFKISANDWWNDVEDITSGPLNHALRRYGGGESAGIRLPKL